jgi:hypothetical protein
MSGEVWGVTVEFTVVMGKDRAVSGRKGEEKRLDMCQ